MGEKQEILEKQEIKYLNLMKIIENKEKDTHLKVQKMIQTNLTNAEKLSVITDRINRQDHKLNPILENIQSISNVVFVGFTSSDGNGRGGNSFFLPKNTKNLSGTPNPCNINPYNFGEGSYPGYLIITQLQYLSLETID